MHFKPIPALLPPLLLTLLPLACSVTTVDNSGDAGAPPADAGIDSFVANDTGSDAAADVGIDAPPVYPAFKPDIGQIVNQGGFILSAPKLVTVTWAGDPYVTDFEKLGDNLGASPYWSTVASEYGIGAVTSDTANHVHINQTPPTTMDETALESFLVSQVNSTTSGWPAPDPQTFYLMYLPQGMTLTSNGMDDCITSLGYHTEVAASASQPHVAYGVVIQHCFTMALLDGATSTATHEILEASSDPHTNSDLAWTDFDKDHYSWELWQGSLAELGDACDNYTDSTYTETGGIPYSVQRMWSNKSAAAGHNPCVPVPANVYFNTTPLNTEAITVKFGTTMVTTHGYHIGVGSTRTIHVGLYSDGSTDAWTLQAVEGDAFTAPTTPHLTLSVDKSAGNNGENAAVTVKVDSVGADTGILMTIVSSKNGEASHYNPILIGAY